MSRYIVQFHSKRLHRRVMVTVKRTSYFLVNYHHLSYNIVRNAEFPAFGTHNIPMVMFYVKGKATCFVWEHICDQYTSFLPLSIMCLLYIRYMNMFHITQSPVREDLNYTKKTILLWYVCIAL